MKVGAGVAALAAAACIAGCGGGGSGPSSPPAPTYTVGGTITGLTGSGLVLQINAGGNLSVAANTTTFAFTTRLTSGSPYDVSVLTFPSTPTQLCNVSRGQGNVGSANVTTIAVNCVNAFTVGGTVTGVAGAGLVLRDNVTDRLTIAADGAFTFAAPLATGSPYNVTANAPNNQSCGVANGSGTVAGANVTNVAVTCTANGFSIDTIGDPLVLEQWHLRNTGQHAFADGVGFAGFDINVNPVYLNFGFTGAGVTVAVVDSGLEIDHEDLATNVVPGGSWNFNTKTTDPTNTVDVDGDHGTSVAGLIAMVMGNSKGGIGVAPEARLKGFNLLAMNPPTDAAFLDSIGGSSSNPNSSDVAIFNQSFGIGATSPTLVAASDEAQYLAGVTSLRGGKGAIYVKAAGNGFNVAGDPPNTVVCPNTGLSCENANFDPDNTLPYQIVVGAINADGVKASYSTSGSAIWVSAPGGEGGLTNPPSTAAAGAALEPAMVTTDQSGCTKGFSRTGVNTSAFDNGGAPNTSCNYTNGMNGSSAATPVTAGVVALMLEANPALTWRDVKHILASTARKIDATGGVVTIPLSGGSYIAEPGWTDNRAPASPFAPTPFHYHNWYGFGLVDAAAAVIMARSYALDLGTFKNTGFIPSPALSIGIPDASLVGASNSLSVPAGTVQVIEAVQIRVSAIHPFVGDLGVELISPAGTRSVLKNIADGYSGSANLSDQVFLSNAFYGENPAGTWTLKVVDGSAGNTGTLTGWAIRVYGH